MSALPDVDFEELAVMSEVSTLVMYNSMAVRNTRRYGANPLRSVS